ncbi:MAG TPA: NADH-quinone oxidoreductase subunit C [Actinospica sp.]|nr:NADH-quinone oxidoreductase subunit C [Actinospica sp.]
METPHTPAAGTRDVIPLSPEALAAAAAGLLDDGYRLGLVSATHRGPDDPRGQAMHVAYLFLASGPASRVELLVELDPAKPEIPSIAQHSFTASRFEREMRDQFGITPVGHPSPRPLVRHPAWPADHHPLRADAAAAPTMTADPEPFPFLTVEGPGVYEIPVGPVHAGLIEPGHFRFSVVGESILKLKARLWYVHKGIEKLFHGRRPQDGIALAERVSGDTAVGHALAYTRAVEDALGITVTAETEAIRTLLLELERLYNHVTDLGALCNDVGHGILNAHAGRLREQLLRINAETTGHRLLRGGIHLGGARLRALPDPNRLRELAAEVAQLAELALSHSVVRDRFTGTAILTRKQAEDLGTLGYVARASGVETDARRDHPAHPDLPVPPAVVHETGDVLARFQQRAAEYEASTAYIEALLAAILTPETPAARAETGGQPRSGAGIAECWRGAVVHRAEIAPDGRLDRVKIVDPSFFNWPALPVALTGAIVPDFPLANKSFNLSYAGNDL